jgi:trans-aconitate 2-methyltransferase
MLGRIGTASPRLVYDLGCGSGNVTQILRARWPEARIIGVDSSKAMLTKAQATGLKVDWMESDLSHWASETPADVIFSNAALHWLDEHAALFPSLLSNLAPGGALAVQMPHNHDAPSHVGMVAAARSGPWRKTLEPYLRENPVGSPVFYWNILAAAGRLVDIWETDYLHQLQGENAVVEWTLGSALKPLLDALEEPWRGSFLAEYRRRMADAYPRQANGVTLFRFRRLFILVKKGDEPG